MSKIDYLASPWETIKFGLKPFRKRYIGMIALGTLGNILGYSLPYFFKIIADRVTGSPTLVTLHAFSGMLIALGVLLVVHELCFRIAHIMETYIAPEAFKYITEDLYSGLVKRPTSYFENKFSGDLGKRITQIGESVSYFIQQFPWEISWLVTSLGMACVLLATTHIYVVVVFLIWLFLFVATSVPLILWHSRRYEEVATAHAELSGTIIDSLANIPLIHSFGAASHEELLNRKKLDALIVVERKARWASVANKFQQGMSIVVLSMSVTITGIFLFSKGEFTIGDFIIIASTIPALASAIWSGGDILVRASKQMGEFGDAVSKLREHQEQLKGGEVDATKQTEYPVHFKDVSFQYPGTEEPVFSGFSLEIKQGEHVGVVGASGAGKSSLVKLLLRQYAAQGGTVSIGSVPIQEFTLKAFNKLISYVPQDTSLFHRSLLDNIAYANHDATREMVIEASKKAHAHDFIEKLPEGYDTKVGERGIKLSGGQRQRIALARAILKDAPILILDEATSSLDSESESLIQIALADLFKHRTVIAIAHRLSTLRAMDRIVVMENGDVLESGAPQDLLESKKSIFKEMWEQQKNGFI